MGDDWKNDKNNIHSHATFNQLPVLQDGSFYLAQSNAIVRYCGRKWGKEGNTNREYALSEAMIEEAIDLYDILSYAKYRNGNTADAWSNAYKSMFKHLDNLERLMNGSKFGTAHTMGDMAIFTSLNIALDSFPTLLNSYLHLKCWYDEIANNDAVAKLLKESAIYLKQPEPMTLTYFGIAARAFAVPVAAAYLWRSDLHWNKISFPQWMGNEGGIKDTPQFGQLPYLEDGGKLMCQSMAIARYVAHKWGLEPSDMKDYAMAEQLIEQSNDIFSLMTKAKYSGDTEEVWREKLSQIPSQLDHVEKLCDGGKFASQKTMADFCLFQAINYYLVSVWDGLKPYPNLTAWYSEIASHRAVKKLISTNPTYYQRTHVELHYFGIKARAFEVAVAAAFMGLKEPNFKWVKYKSEDWQANKDDVKSHCHFGQLPMLKNGSRSIVQSMAIARYCAKIWYIEGGNAKDYAISEQLMEVSTDMNKMLIQAKYWPPNANTPDQWDEYLAKFPKIFSQLEKLMGGNKFTEDTTMGEFSLFAKINAYVDNVPNGLDNFKALNAWYNNIASNEAVAALLKSVPAYFKKP